MPKRPRAHTKTQAWTKEWAKRRARSTQDRIFLDPFEQSYTKDKVTVTIIGTTGNQYIISILRGGQTSCSCYDCKTSGFFCKHLMHVLLFVFQVPEDLVDQCQSKTHDVYLDCAKNYFERRELKLCKKSELEIDVQKPIEEDDDCAICCENLLKTIAKKEPIIWCKKCGKTVHQICFSHWREQTCVFCRARWA